MVEELVAFIRDLSGAINVKTTSDIYGDLGMGGDDFHEMIEKYAKKYVVDMSSYLWYFHADEEGWSIGRLFFSPPYNRVKRIPVTPEMLTNFANKGKWEIDYPDHKLPAKRYDILINRIIAGLLAIVIGIALIRKYTT